MYNQALQQCKLAVYSVHVPLATVLQDGLQLQASTLVFCPRCTHLLPATPCICRPQNSTEQLDRLEKAFDEVKARLLGQVSRPDPAAVLPAGWCTSSLLGKAPAVGGSPALTAQPPHHPD